MAQETYSALDWQSVSSASFVTAVLAALLIYVVVGKKESRKSRPLPPGPRPWPVIGNMGAFGALAHRDLADLAKQYGPIMLLRLGYVSTVVVTSPQIAEEIMKTHDQVFSSRPRPVQSEIMSYGSQNLVFSPYGPYWRYIRKLFMLELLTTRRLMEFQGTRRDEVILTLQSLAEECKGGQPVTMKYKFKEYVNNIVTRMMMNKRFYGRSNSVPSNTDLEAVQLIENAKELSRLYGVFDLGDYFPFLRKFDLQGYKKQMRKVRDKNDLFFDKIIEEHRQRLRQGSAVHDESAKQKMDFVDVLLSCEPNGTDGKSLTNDQIKALLVDIIIGGTDTTSTTLEWAMAELINAPDVMKRAQEELDAVVGRERLVEESDIPRLEYMHAIVKEVLRLHPVVPMLVPRQSIEACEVGGYYIPKETQVLVNIWAIGRDPAIWNRPLEFFPERFLSSNVDFAGQHFELLPFGSGRRSCPGRALGVMMIEHMLAGMLHSFDWSLPQGKNPELDLAEAAGISNPLAIPLEAVATPRLPLAMLYAHHNSE